MGLLNTIFLLWGLSIDAWITIATVMAVIGVMLFTKVRTDAVMLIAVGVLFAAGVLDAKETCSGFSSGTVVVTGVLAVVMAGLRYTGVLQWMLKHVFGLPKNYVSLLTVINTFQSNVLMMANTFCPNMLIAINTFWLQR